MELVFLPFLKSLPLFYLTLRLNRRPNNVNFLNVGRWGNAILRLAWYVLLFHIGSFLRFLRFDRLKLRTVFALPPFFLRVDLIFPLATNRTTDR